DAKMRAPRLIELRDRVRVVAVELRAATHARVIVEASGRLVEASVDTGVPAADLALQRSKLQRKFLALATPVLGAAAADQLRRRRAVGARHARRRRNSALGIAQLTAQRHAEQRASEPCWIRTSDPLLKRRPRSG